MTKKKECNESDLLLDINLDKNTLNIDSIEDNDQLKTVKKKKQPLNKDQQRFYDLIKKIEKLEKQLVDIRQLAVELTFAYSNEISPVEKKLGEAYFEFAVLLDDYAQSLKLTKIQRADFNMYMMDLCDSALGYTEPNELQETLYDKYNELSYKEKLRVEKPDLPEPFDCMEDEMDVDEAYPDSAITNEEAGLSNMNRRIASEKRNLPAEETEVNDKIRKHQEEEQNQKSEDEFLKKLLRLIYLSFSRMLHLDEETNEERNPDKTDLMKQVTAAYDQKDLATLQKLEMSFVHWVADNLPHLTDEKRTFYSKVLNEQAEELNREIIYLKKNPACINIFKWLHYPPKQALSSLENQKKELLSELENIKRNIKIFENQPSKKSILIKHLKNAAELYADDVFEDSFSESLFL